jgi:hypothetical protein
MATKTITELLVAAPLSGSEYLEIEQSGGGRKIELQKLKNFITGSSSSSSSSESAAGPASSFTFEGFHFITSANSPSAQPPEYGLWFEQGVSAQSPPTALQSGDITNNEISVLTLVSGFGWPASAGQLSFYYATSSEDSYDTLNFYINGFPQDDPYDASGFINFTPSPVYNISPGDKIQWKYTKDSSDFDGLDTSWIDTITLIPGSSSSSSFSVGA